MYLYDRKALKNAAKNDLKGKYWISVLVCLIFEAILYCCGYVHVVASLLVAGSLGYGYAYYFTDILRHGEAKIGNLFIGFKNYVGTLVIGLLKMLFVLLWSLLLVVPGIIKYIAYSMAFYIKRDNPDMTAKECLAASVRLTKGHKGKIFVLALSFFGWYILAGFAVGYIFAFTQAFAGLYFYYAEVALYSLAMILIMPYYTMAFARMYDFLILNYNEQHGGNDTISEDFSQEAVATEAENSAEESTTEENPFNI
ncbi:MAG: DUF975 family protein [Bacillota bacterium]